MEETSKGNQKYKYYDRIQEYTGVYTSFSMLPCFCSVLFINKLKVSEILSVSLRFKLLINKILPK